MTIEHRCMYPDCDKKTGADTDDGKGEIRISHSICPECLKKHFPEEAEEPEVQK